MGATPILMLTDAELVRRCRAGDSAAWEQIVHLFSRRVYNLAYRFTNRHEAAEDLTQEVFVRVYRSLDQYDPAAGDLSNWLMRLARNLVIDDYRKRVRTPTDVGEDLTDHEFHLRSSSDSPDRRVERDERASQVHRGNCKIAGGFARMRDFTRHRRTELSGNCRHSGNSAWYGEIPHQSRAH